MYTHEVNTQFYKQSDADEREGSAFFSTPPSLFVILALAQSDCSSTFSLTSPSPSPYATYFLLDVYTAPTQSTVQYDLDPSTRARPLAVHSSHGPSQYSRSVPQQKIETNSHPNPLFLRFSLTYPLLSYGFSTNLKISSSIFLYLHSGLPLTFFFLFLFSIYFS